MYQISIDRDPTLHQSLAKWKREAEAWYGQDSAMLEGMLHTVEEQLVRKCLTYALQRCDFIPLHIGKGRRS